MNTKEPKKIFHLSFSNSHLSLKLTESRSLRYWLSFFSVHQQDREVRRANNASERKGLKMKNENWKMINGKSVLGGNS